MKKITSVLTNYPLISYGVTIMLINLTFFSFQFDYDTNTVVTILTFILPIMALPYWVVQEVFNFSYEVNIILALIVFVLLELIYQTLNERTR